jgi:dihydrofolate reductase
MTYSGFATAWPGRKDEQGFAAKMNSMPKYVVSETLEKADWNNSHIIKADAVMELVKLKGQTGGDMLVNGSRTLIQTLMQHNLVDEYRLLIYPIVLGRGIRLFEESTEAKLKLTETKAFTSGVVLLRYEPAVAEVKSGTTENK